MLDSTHPRARRQWISRRWLPFVCAGASLASSALLAADQSGETQIFYNAQIFTAEYDHPYAEAVAIRGDRIVAVGALQAVEQAAGAAARKIDLKGKFLMPGMIDAHAHPIVGGVTLIQANFPDTADSVPALAQFVAEQMKTNESRLGDVLVINGIDIGYWSHAAEIDGALSTGGVCDQPIVLFGSDGHTAWANGPARTRAGITAKYIKSLQIERAALLRLRRRIQSERLRGR